MKKVNLSNAKHLQTSSLYFQSRLQPENSLPEETDNTSKVAIKDSIATRLLRVVFSFYLIVAIGMTVFHMVAEYEKEKIYSKEDLRMIEETFRDTLVKGVWNLDEGLQMAAMEGIIKMPSVIGIKMITFVNNAQKGLGVILNEDNQVVRIDDKGRHFAKTDLVPFDELYWYSFQLKYKSLSNKQSSIIGEVYLYSSTGLILNKIKFDFLIIVINAVLKTIALWLIFLVVSRRLLLKPLAELNRATGNLDLDTLEDNTINIRTNGRNELKLLEDAFNSMVEKLGIAKKRLLSFQHIHKNILDNGPDGTNLFSVFDELCTNIGKSDGVLYVCSEKNEYQAIRFFQDKNSFFIRKFSMDLEKELFPHPDLDIVIENNVTADSHLYRFFHFQNQGHVHHGHVMFTRNPVFEKAVILLFRKQEQPLFDKVDGLYVDSFWKEIKKARQNVHTIREESRMKAEIETASLVQKSFLPKKKPDIAGFDIAMFYQPAREVSGDYYDFIKIDDQFTGIVIADASGKGLPAAMYAGNARVLLRDKATRTLDPLLLFLDLNESLQSEWQSNQFLTMCYVLLDRKNAVISYVNAGHEPLVLIKSNENRCELLKPSGFPFCALDTHEFEARLKKESYRLDPGDTIFFYTDGVTDLINPQGDMFEADRLYQLLSDCHGKKVDTVIANIHRECTTFQGDNEQPDDITMIAVQRL